jgi:cell division protein FtsQ
MIMPRKHAQRRKPKPTAQAKRWFSLPAVSWSQAINGTLLLLTGVGAWAGTTWLMEQPINAVSIDGSFERVQAVQIEAAVMPYIKAGELTADLADLRNIIVALPWVQDESVRRSWPSTLNIKITEERAAARWGDKGLLNVYGELFVRSAKHVPAGLPRLEGPEGSELHVARQYFALNTQLEQRGLNATVLRMDERGSLSLGLSNGMEVRFGTVDLEERTTRFFQALDEVLTPIADRINYIDMRYTNGFAVGWKPAGELKLADRGDSEPHA